MKERKRERERESKKYKRRKKDRNVVKRKWKPPSWTGRTRKLTVSTRMEVQDAPQSGDTRVGQHDAAVGSPPWMWRRPMRGGMHLHRPTADGATDYELSQGSSETADVERDHQNRGLRSFQKFLSAPKTVNLTPDHGAVWPSWGPLGGPKACTRRKEGRKKARKKTARAAEPSTTMLP